MHVPREMRRSLPEERVFRVRIATMTYSRSFQPHRTIPSTPQNAVTFPQPHNPASPFHHKAIPLSSPTPVLQEFTQRMITVPYSQSYIRIRSFGGQSTSTIPSSIKYYLLPPYLSRLVPTPVLWSCIFGVDTLRSVAL